MENNQQIDDLVSMIDQFMSEGGGHMDVHVKDNGEIHTKKTLAKTVTKTNSLDCCPDRDMACAVPTLFEGMDREPEDDNL